jgi:hypothetical protein
MSDGTQLHGMRVLNPFGASALSQAAAALLATD